MSFTVQDIRTYSDSPPLTMLTAYDAPTASLVEEAGIDIILVGDSMGNAVLGYDTTIPVTMEEILSRTAAVVRGTDDTLIVADMPFLSVGTDRQTSIENCGTVLKETGADAVKIECGSHTVDLTQDLVELGIPVMAHLGLTPQRVKELGGYAQQGDSPQEAQRILDLARQHESAGAFALVLEHIPAKLAAEITEELSIPTIGIGAGNDCNGQVLVFNDVVGLNEWAPSFAKQFGDVRGEILSAVEEYADSVRSGSFPNSEEE
ncbi:3-methyl-2-oxobutanoate hydroxymethyltransferase [Salinarchaeum sp. IM2453]|uniref:3-methyl-2-oxobutanoate hydroxymethyltransferase n=1 Tax=Salinarchaeum sp. IM2453 TaxID=2862870 RepID=UPI001C82998C|nr:3-methyl-2-oxobutanoate hydroxymethyltransferase [Salinarchaeum sp. IM2453]QZA87676.1 3-methyl-2-oxobutanoate hydroxymethyltransferase [Salinarchaeum sp. IM2453]